MKAWLLDKYLNVKSDCVADLIMKVYEIVNKFFPRGK